MDVVDINNAEEIFQEVVRLPIEDRRSALAERCGANAPLRRLRKIAVVEQQVSGRAAEPIRA